MKTTYAKNRTQWRQWLRRNHRNASEIWLILYKKHTRKRTVTYNDAVEESLCFGWVDNRVKAIDNQRYAQRFTPRKPGSVWSPSNVARMKTLLDQGKVTAAGHAAFTGHERRVRAPRPSTLSAELRLRFRAHGRAWKNFERFPPGYRRMTIAWVASAKRGETRYKRLDQLIRSSARNQRLTFI